MLRVAAAPNAPDPDGRPFAADIIRESIDGATMYELVAAAEGWEPQPWLTPWQPAD